MIALENHGGGFLLIGFTEDQGRLIPARQRSPNFEEYGTDAVNAIVSSFAEPSFHVHATVQKHPETVKNFRLSESLGFEGARSISPCNPR